METGVNPDATDEEDLSLIISKAADRYMVDKSLLEILISSAKEYSMTLTGGMGLTTISTENFLRSSFQNPYRAEDNIMAAAETIASMKAKGLRDDEIIFAFITGSNQENIKLFAKSEYERAVELANTYRTTVANTNKSTYVK